MGLFPTFPIDSLRQSRGLSPQETADFMCFTDMAGAGSGAVTPLCVLRVFSSLGAAGAAHKSAVSRNCVPDVPGHEFFYSVLVLV